MSSDLSQINPTRRSGDEVFHSDGCPYEFSVLDFWRWSSSDLVSNARRGVLAEYIVGSALGITQDNVRDEWAAYDLLSPEGIRVEVKSAAYIQSWSQRQLSSITFKVRKTRAWSAETNIQEKESRRQAQVYVFALLAHQDKRTIDPVNVKQWRFYVLPTSVLDARTRSQHSITLRSLEALAGDYVAYDGLRAAIQQAARQETGEA